MWTGIVFLQLFYLCLFTNVVIIFQIYDISADTYTCYWLVFYKVYFQKYLITTGIIFVYISLLS